MDHLYLEGARLLQLLDTRLDAQLQKVDLAGKARAKMVVNALHVRGDIHFKRRPNSRKFQVVEHAHGCALLLERLAQNRCALLAELEAESRGIVSVQRRNRGSEYLFDGIEGALGRGSGAGPAAPLKVQRDALHFALVELHSCQSRFLGDRG